MNSMTYTFWVSNDDPHAVLAIKELFDKAKASFDTNAKELILGDDAIEYMGPGYDLKVLVKDLFNPPYDFTLNEEYVTRVYDMEINTLSYINVTDFTISAECNAFFPNVKMLYNILATSDYGNMIHLSYAYRNGNIFDQYPYTFSIYDNFGVNPRPGYCFGGSYSDKIENAMNNPILFDTSTPSVFAYRRDGYPGFNKNDVSIYTTCLGKICMDVDLKGSTESELIDKLKPYMSNGYNPNTLREAVDVFKNNNFYTYTERNNICPIEDIVAGDFTEKELVNIFENYQYLPANEW